MLNKKTNIILAISAVIGFILLIIFAPDSDTNDQSSDNQILPKVVEENIDIVNARYRFNNGRHELAGTIIVPDVCTDLSWDVAVKESMPEQIVLSFQTIRDEDQICAQVISEESFYINIAAAKEARINATLNGSPIELNLIPVPLDEDLQSDFNVKG